MHKLPQPVKVRYWGPFFRYEAPQAGRYRQFTQVGIEAIGSDDPSLDAEAILLLAELLERAQRQGRAAADLQPRHAGDPPRLLGRAARVPARARGPAVGRRPRAARPQPAPRLRLGPRRARARWSRDAPRLLDRLGDEDARHFAEVRALLDAEGLEYEVDPTLVRGLDYYTRTVFEFSSDALGAQSQLGGGGRYDGLIEQLGGPPTPGVGFAAGVERILLASDFEAASAAPSVFVAYTGDRSREAFGAMRELRARGKSAQRRAGGQVDEGTAQARQPARGRRTW